MEATSAGDGHVERMIEHGRRARGEVQELRDSVEALAAEAREALVEQLEVRPYVTLGVAAGLGYVVGVAWPRTGGAAMRFGGRIVLNLAVARAAAALGSAAAARQRGG